MSFFEHRGGERPDYLAPRRVYARVDESSTDRRGGQTFFDAVDADWLDEVGASEGGLLTTPEAFEESRAHVSTLLVRRNTARHEEGAIAEIHLDDRHADGTAEHFLSLTSAPIARTVKRLDWVTGTDRKRVAAAGNLGAVQDATRDEIEEALGAYPIDAVGVYDVGQGNLNAAIVGDTPQTYFDFGGGCDANRDTFPRAFDGVCLHADPAIVLSHFHHDHWASVARFPEVLGLDWIVPRQGPTLGFSHAVLIGAIRRDGRVLVWPNEHEKLGRGQIEVHRCTGTHRNDSGLAMVISGPDGRRVLLPADARYRYISVCPPEVTSLVVAHHGGRTNAREDEIPRPDAEPSGRLVYSLGRPNTYGHALASPAAAHASVWGDANLVTANRGNGDVGNVHLYWEPAADDVSAPPCLAGAMGPNQR
jgi:hypothetical protein